MRGKVSVLLSALLGSVGPFTPGAFELPPGSDDGLRDKAEEALIIEVEDGKTNEWSGSRIGDSEVTSTAKVD